MFSTSNFIISPQDLQIKFSLTFIENFRNIALIAITYYLHYKIPKSRNVPLKKNGRKTQYTPMRVILCAISIHLLSPPLSLPFYLFILNYHNHTRLNKKNYTRQCRSDTDGIVASTITYQTVPDRF